MPIIAGRHVEDHMDHHYNNLVKSFTNRNNHLQQNYIEPIKRDYLIIFILFFASTLLMFFIRVNYLSLKKKD